MRTSLDDTHHSIKYGITLFIAKDISFFCYVWQNFHPYFSELGLKQSRAEWKESLLSIQNMGKCLHRVFKAIVN